jgi:hypothetical protein
MKFGLDKLQLFCCFSIFTFSLQNLTGLRDGWVRGHLLGCSDQLHLAVENEDNILFKAGGNFLILQLTRVEKCPQIFFKQTMWYSNVLFELFRFGSQSAISVKNQICGQASSVTAIFFFRNFVWHCQPANLPTHFYIIFSSKLVGLRGWGEPDHFVRKLWISCRLQ